MKSNSHSFSAIFLYGTIITMLLFVNFNYSVAQNSNKSKFATLSNSSENAKFIDDNSTGTITIKVLETKGSDVVKYLAWSTSDNSPESKRKFGTVPVVQKDKDGYFRMNNFTDKKGKTVKGFEYLLLFDKDENLLGHVTYEYHPEEEAGFIRQLILILHNSDFDCLDDLKKKCYPYSKENPYYEGFLGGQWTYFEKGEFPVTMLIPPDFKDAKSGEFIGNIFPIKLDKKPTLFVHGLTGKYNLFSKADVSKNETSYWWNEVRHFNKSNKFVGWQIYYPFDANLDFIAKWLKYDVEYLKKLYGKEVNIVTHSMGGLAIMELITSSYFNAKENLHKVFLSEPPLYGSLGGNKQYRTGRGRVFQMLGFDREAPSIKDMSYGSDFYFNLHNRKWPSLDDDKYLFDDYFVLIGTTQDEYKLPKMVHLEADKQTDGIVAMSSASLMQHNIRFATFPGNHDDGRGCWSAITQKEGEGFLSEITKTFFEKSITEFQKYLVGKPMVESYIDYRTNNIKVKYKLENVNLKQGGYAIRLKKQKGVAWNNEITKWDDLIVLSNRKSKTLVLCPKLSGASNEERFVSHNNLDEIIKLYPKHEGFMSLNKFTSGDYISYFFTRKPEAVEDCVSDMPEGNYNVLFYFSEKGFCIDLGMLNFKHLNVKLKEFDLSKHESPFFTANMKTSFTNYIPKIGERADSTFVPDTTITIYEGAKKAIFQMISVDAQKGNKGFYIHVKNPNNFLVSSKLSSVKWKHNPKGAYRYYVIDKPTPGKWEIGGRVSSKSKKRMYYTILIHQEFDKDDLKSAKRKEKKENKELKGRLLDSFRK